jgi:hypothetical protein
MTYLISHPQKINNFVAGPIRRQAGLCARKRRADGRWVYVDKETGDEFEEIKVADMAHDSRFVEDGAIHKILYKFLCEFVHPDFVSLMAYVDGHEFDEADRNMTIQATICSALYACFILDLFFLFKPLKQRFRKDMERFLTDTKGNFQTVLSTMTTEGNPIDLLELLKKHVNRSVIDK